MPLTFYKEEYQMSITAEEKAKVISEFATKKVILVHRKFKLLF